MIKGLHHLNFIVADLDAWAGRLSAALGIEPGPVEALPERGVLIRRFRAGATWIVLVQPTDADQAPARYLARHGEGYFLASFEVDGLDAALERLEQAGMGAGNAPRAGLDDWRVVDLDAPQLAAFGLQLVEEGES